MTATGHAILGTIIAIKIGDPKIAAPIALVSHAITDYIPHWDTAVNIKKKGKRLTIIHSIVDVFSSFIISYLIIFFFSPKTSISYAFLMVFIAQFFDWVTVPYYFFNIKAFQIFYKFQKLFDRPLNNSLGVVTQASIIIAVTAVAIFLKF